jgi:hypothetical protein
LVAGELALNTNDGKLYYKDSAGVVQVLAGKGGAGVAGGSNTQVQYNSSGSLAGSANMTFDGTTLTTTGISDSGNLTFTGTGNRITGDFSNATAANRVAFQTSTVNTNTSVSVIPNGTATATAFRAYGNSDPTNANSISIVQVGTTEARISSEINGTATVAPITMFIGTSERLRIDTSGNVGIGSTPSAIGSYKVLEISGTSGGYISLKQSGTEYGNLYGDPTTGTTLSASGARNIVFQTNGGERMRIDSSGNVGIGTSSPDTNNKLTVSQTTTSGGTEGIRLNQTSSGQNGLAMQRAGGTASYWLMYQPTSSTDIRWFNGLADKLVLAYDGSLGVNGSSLGGRFEVFQSTLGSNFRHGSGTYFNISTGAANGTVDLKADAQSGGYPPLTFYTGGSERMRINSSGNVLVNRTTSSTTCKLEVSGAIRFDNNTTQSASTNNAYGMAFARANFSVTGGTGANVIKGNTGSEASFYLVSGVLSSAGRRFFDIVVTMGASLVSVLNSGVVNGPATRTYTSTGENLSVSLSGTDTYTVYVTGIGSNESQ